MMGVLTLALLSAGWTGLASAQGRGGAVVMTGPGGGQVVVGPGRVVVRRAPAAARVGVPMPAPRASVWEPPSQPGEVWIEGYWGWSGNDWTWVDGHWELPPQPGAIWVSPQMGRRGWVPGHWTTPSWGGRLPAAARPYQLGSYVSGVFTPQDPVDPTGAPFHDYAVLLEAGQQITFLAVGGPVQGMGLGRRAEVAVQVLWNGQVLAQDLGMPGMPDARVVVLPPQRAVVTVRVSARPGSAFQGGTYVLESGAAGWAVPQSPFDQIWGPHQQPPVIGPQVPQVLVQPPPSAVVAPPADCRGTLLQMGHDASALMFCDDVDPVCADTLLRAGHDPSALIHCGDVRDRACAVTLLRQGRGPEELIHCR
jgi:hypothetical protein